jgi:hypothetical protein
VKVDFHEVFIAGVTILIQYLKRLMKKSGVLTTSNQVGYKTATAITTKDLFSNFSETIFFVYCDLIYYYMQDVLAQLALETFDVGMCEHGTIISHHKVIEIKCHLPPPQKLNVTCPPLHICSQIFYTFICICCGGWSRPGIEEHIMFPYVMKSSVPVSRNKYIFKLAFRFESNIYTYTHFR